MKHSVIFMVLLSLQTLLSQPITLRDTTNQYDYIIITVPEYVSACETFRQHKETVRNFRTLIVDTTQIFAEFDSSFTPQDNIRDFISYAGTFWKEARPKFFFLAGNVESVPNFLIPFNGPPPPVYFNSDFYYTQNIYENDSTTTDFYIGRIPCKNSTELTNYLSKVIEYENSNSLKSWMNNNLFICQDDTVFGFLETAISISENYLPDFIRSFFIVNDSNSIYYGNKDSIYSAINNRGNSILWFIGRHTDSFFISPDYFKLDDIQGINNNPKFYFTIFAAAQHSIIDVNTNLSKEMLVMQNAGSLGGSVFVGNSWWGVGNVFRNIWAQRIFDPSVQSISEAFVLDNFVSSGGIFNYMKKITNLWADPSIKLKFDVTVDVNEPEVEMPKEFTLKQNYPNPFNPATKINYSIPNSSSVVIKVFDLLGNEVATLIDEEKPAGSYDVSFDAKGLPSGIYFYQLNAGNFTEAKKMILLK